MNAVWTEGMCDQLKAMHEDGSSYNEIASALGVSRNSAIGRGHRLGLRSKRTISEQMVRRRKPRQAKSMDGKHNGHGAMARNARIARDHFGSVKLAPLPPEPPKPPTCEPVTMMDLTDKHCKFILGDPAGLETQFCGGTVETTPYCGFHAARCFNAEYRRSALGRGR